MAEININDIQKAFISRLKANAQLVVDLGGTADEIREIEWMGNSYLYPCIRVATGPINPWMPIPTCGIKHTIISIFCFSEQASSMEVNIMGGHVYDYFNNRNFTENGIMFIRTLVTDVVDAIRQDERTWISEIKLDVMFQKAI